MRMYVWMDGCMDVWMYGCMCGCMDGWMDVWMYVRMYVCMDVWMYVCMYEAKRGRSKTDNVLKKKPLILQQFSMEAMAHENR